jgi:hypothetical protein
MTATLSTRVNYAVPHLLAAARFSRAVKVIEAANVGQPFGEWWEEMRDNAVACLFVASATIESYTNELFSDRDKVFPDAPALLIGKIWEMSERKAPVEQFDLVLQLRSKPPLDRKAGFYKAMLAVIRLRNELTHFKPEWSHQINKHKKTSDVLKGYFKADSPHFRNEQIFPSAWVGHSCTSWAVNTTLRFIEEFEKLAGLTGRTDRAQFGGRLNP